MTKRTCACCGTVFEARTADVARGWAKFCSKACKARKQEARTGQYKAYLERGGADRDDIAAEGEGPGWDEHKGHTFL